MALSLTTSNKRSSSTAGLFKVETEEELKEATVIVKKRKLITLEDNSLPEDESVPMKVEPNETNESNSIPMQEEKPVVDPVAEAKAKAIAIVDRIPKEKEELFAYVIDWPLLAKVLILFFFFVSSLVFGSSISFFWYLLPNSTIANELCKL